MQQRVSMTISAGGLSFAAAVNRDLSPAYTDNTSYAAGTAGNLTTRTDNIGGEVTLGGNHGQTNGVYDVFWTGAGNVRYGMNGTVAGNALTINGGNGANLPAANTALVVCKETVVPLAFSASTLGYLCLAATERSHVCIRDANAAPVFAYEIPAGNEACVWWSNSGHANPLNTTNSADVVVSNGQSSNASIIRVIAAVT